LTPRVLHVLPHPGGGGETYIDEIAAMEGFSFERVYLAARADPAGAHRAILRRAVEVQRAAFRFDLIHVVGEVAGSLCLPALAARPSVLSPQGLSLLRRMDAGRKRAARANLRLLVRAASRTLCSSSTEYSDVLDAAGRRAAESAMVICNGVAVPAPASASERAAVRAELGIPPTKVLGVWAGGLDENKDPITVIRALNSVRRDGAPVVVLMAGDGPLRAEVEAAARETDAVSVLGFRDDVERILAVADFFVLASRWEGLSFSLLEAMSHALAPVVSDAPGNVEAVGDAGMVVSYGDEAGFARAFARVVADETWRLGLGKLARERVFRRFSIDEMRDRTRSVYASLVAGRSSRPTGSAR
jgi:glycosyltransferase involved in cell wall biosynthesis